MCPRLLSGLTLVPALPSRESRESVDQRHQLSSQPNRVMIGEEEGGQCKKPVPSSGIIGAECVTPQLESQVTAERRRGEEQCWATHLRPAGIMVPPLLAGFTCLCCTSMVGSALSFKGSKVTSLHLRGGCEAKKKTVFFNIFVWVVGDPL